MLVNSSGGKYERPEAGHFRGGGKYKNIVYFSVIKFIERRGVLKTCPADGLPGGV